MTPRLSGLAGALVLIALGLALVGAALGAGGLASDGSRRSAGSSWSDGPRGASRLHDMLRLAGRTVRRHEGAPDTLPVEGVFVALQPPGGLTTAEEAELLARVERGATLVLASPEVPAALTSLGLAVRSHPLTGVATPLVPSAVAAAAPGLAARGDALLDAVPGVAPLYATEEGVLLGGLVLGEGLVFLLTDPALLQNRALDQAANVRLAGALFAASPGPITFLEGLHGYTAARGLVPWLWRSGWGGMLLLALLAGVLAGWRAAVQAPRPAPGGRRAGGGLVRLARGVGRMRLDQGLHARTLGEFLQEARRRRIPDDHPAVAAARKAWRDPQLGPEDALDAAARLEQTWRDCAWRTSGASPRT